MPGGSADDYDYCNAEPIGCVDLDGNLGLKKWWHDHHEAAVHFVVGVATAVVVSISIGVVCGATAGVGCAVFGGFALGMLANTATQVTAAAAMNEKVTGGKVAGWALTGGRAGAVGSSVRVASGKGSLGLLASAAKKRSLRKSYRLGHRGFRAMYRRGWWQ